MKYFLLATSCLLFLLFGCSTPPVQVELTDVQARYRPDDQKPTLPKLTAGSQISDFINYAILNNPKIEASFYEWKMAVQEIAVAKSLPYPQLTLSAEVKRVVTTLLVGFMQTIPGPGKLSLQAELYSIEAQQKRYLFEDEILNTVFKVYETYYESILVNRKTRLVNELIGLVETQEASLQAGLGAGLNSAEELIMVRVEKERLRKELADLDDACSLLSSCWYRVLGVHFSCKDFCTTILPAIKMPLAEQTLPAESDLDKMVANNVRLKALVEEIKHAQTLIQVAHKENLSDVTVGYGVDARSGYRMSAPSLGITLPLWRKRISAQIAGARAHQKHAEALLSAEQIELAVLFAEKSYLWRQLQRETNLVRDELVPLAEVKAKSLEAAYKSGRVRLSDWVKARNELIELQIQLVTAITMKETVYYEISLVLQSHWPEEATKIFTADLPAVVPTLRVGTQAGTSLPLQDKQDKQSTPEKERK
ncbi:MAG: TolC family protein [Planctomycetes bacterium]|nr:TolC family protein [Planctomycetota bacterium]